MFYIVINYVGLNNYIRDQTEYITAFNRFACTTQSVTNQYLLAPQPTTAINVCCLRMMMTSCGVQIQFKISVVVWCPSVILVIVARRFCPAPRACPPAVAHVSSGVVAPNTWLSLNSSCSLVARRLGLLSPRNERTAAAANFCDGVFPFV